MPKIGDKLTQLKALLGDESAKEVVAEAERREKAAKKAGVEFKEQDEPVKLSKLLDDIDSAIALGTVIDDVNEAEAEAETPAPEAEKEVGLTLDQFKSAVSEIVDAKITALKEELAKPAKTEKEQQDETEQARQQEVDALKIAIKEAQEALTELMGEQPRNAGFRASRSDTTVKENSQVPAGPGPDPLMKFIDDLVLKSPNGNA